MEVGEETLLKIKKIMTKEQIDKIKGVFFGQAIGDADTNACVGGSLLGAKFGFQSIPTKWINELKYKNELELVFENYIKCVQSSEGGSTTC